jgi:hypothetical protein
MSTAILPLQHDYLVLSLSSLREPVVVVERLVVGIQVVQDLEGVIQGFEGVVDGIMTTGTIE